MIEFTPAMMTIVVDYIAEVFTDLSLVILLIVGVGVGLMVIGVVIKALRG